MTRLSLPQSLAIFISFATVGGCKTPPTTDDRPTPIEGPSRTMMDLDDEPLTDVWSDWTPVDSLAAPDLRELATAFDYLQITDEAFTESAWTTGFAVLDEARGQLGGRYAPTFRMLMTVLEPDTEDGERGFDATFVVSRSDGVAMWEGVAYRMWRELPSGASPTVTVFLRRWEGGTETPSQIHLWFYSAFEEAPSATLMLQVDDGGWSMTANEGIAWEPSKRFDGEPDVLAGILLESLWEPVAGTEYLENEIARRNKTGPTPEALPRAMGLKLDDRTIDQVFSDSVFAPRLTEFD